MKTTDALVSWLNNLHNEVNAGLGKPNIPKKYADSYYVKNGRLTYDFRDFVVLFRIMTMIKKLNFPAIIKFIQLLYEIYPDGYLHRNAPKSLELVNIIQNNVKLNEWIVHFDMEHAKNKNSLFGSALIFSSIFLLSIPITINFVSESFSLKRNTL